MKCLLAVDLTLSRKLAIFSDKSSFRPLMILLELSCHGIPWLCGVVYLFMSTKDNAVEEIFFNLFIALVLDLVVVCVLKMIVRRKRPNYNKDDMFVTISVDKYSFPSGHATRAYMVTWFLLFHLKFAVPIRFLLRLWSNMVGLSRVMLGRHHISDVLVGFIVGYCEYYLIERAWYNRDWYITYVGFLKS